MNIYISLLKDPVVKLGACMCEFFSSFILLVVTGVISNTGNSSFLPIMNTTQEMLKSYSFCVCENHIPGLLYRLQI